MEGGRGKIWSSRSETVKILNNLQLFNPKSRLIENTYFWLQHWINQICVKNNCLHLINYGFWLYNIWEMQKLNNCWEIDFFSSITYFLHLPEKWLKKAEAPFFLLANLLFDGRSVFVFNYYETSLNVCFGKNKVSKWFDCLKVN